MPQKRLKKYSVTAFDFATERGFGDLMNTHTDDLEEARSISQEQANQWCETQYGKLLKKIDLHPEKKSEITKTTLLKMKGKWGIMMNATLIEGYVCNDGEQFGSAIRQNY